MKTTSWTGSENQRRPQGTCHPPKQEPDLTPRFLVPTGVQAEARHVDTTTWIPWTTRRECSFESYERYRDLHYTFREGGFLLRVHRRYVVHRDDQENCSRPRPR